MSSPRKISFQQKPGVQGEGEREAGKRQKQEPSRLEGHQGHQGGDHPGVFGGSWLEHSETG